MELLLFNTVSPSRLHCVALKLHCSHLSEFTDFLETFATVCQRAQ